MSIRFILAALLLWTALGASPPASAQASGSIVLSRCGVPSVAYNSGDTRPETQDTTASKCVAGPSWNYANITTATTTVVKSSAGMLHTICENTVLATGSVSLYDNTTGSGQSMGKIVNPLTLLQMGPVCAIYDINFANGLTVVTTGAQDITIGYR